MRFLQFVSLFLLTVCNPKIAHAGDFVNPELNFWTSELRDSVQKNDYRITIVTDKFNISGIWVVRRIDNSWRGIMMNEFGLKIFDFICTEKKCELKNVVALADKWYIRKTIADDIQFILEIDNPDFKKALTTQKNLDNNSLTITGKNNMLQRFSNGDMVMLNKKRGLKYVFNKI